MSDLLAIGVALLGVASAMAISHCAFERAFSGRSRRGAAARGESVE